MSIHAVRIAAFLVVCLVFLRSVYVLVPRGLAPVDVPSYLFFSRPLPDAANGRQCFVRDFGAMGGAPYRVWVVEHSLFLGKSLVQRFDVDDAPYDSAGLSLSRRFAPKTYYVLESTLALVIIAMILRRKRRDRSTTQWQANPVLRCGTCGYDLRVQASDYCPECGSLNSAVLIRQDRPILEGLMLIGPPILLVLGTGIAILLAGKSTWSTAWHWATVVVIGGVAISYHHRAMRHVAADLDQERMWWPATLICIAGVQLSALFWLA